MVVRATPKAAQVEGSMKWYHLSHCTIVPKKDKVTIKLTENNENNDSVVQISDEHFPGSPFEV